MLTIKHTRKPYEVEISGSGFCSLAHFATMDEAYAEAHRIRELAEADKPVAFSTATGPSASSFHPVLAIRILCWNPLINDLLSHARRWTLTDTPKGALTPLPAAWHREPLPDDWFGQPTVA